MSDIFRYIEESLRFTERPEVASKSSHDARLLRLCLSIVS